MAAPDRPATVKDVHRVAEAMPHVSVVQGRIGNRIYQVGASPKQAETWLQAHPT